MDKRLARQFNREPGKGRQNYIAPKGMLKAEFDEAKASGCTQAFTREYYEALQVGMKYNVCNGCPEWVHHGPKCECFQQYHTAFRDAKAKIIVEEARQKELHTRKTERCPDCGLRIRGPNHYEGRQHMVNVGTTKK